jgi:5-methylcytosine-specific restriction endonuclease McrA
MYQVVWNLTKQDGVCSDCVKAVLTALRIPNSWPRDLWEADHIVPRSDGGTNLITNLRTLCRPCHVEITTEWRRTPSPSAQGH